ncbi:MAG: helix-turn-helix domain-containing protein [Candidatus Acidiferrales bacterium]
MKLREMLATRKLSQKSLAAAVRIHPVRLSRLITGRRKRLRGVQKPR